MRAGSAAAATVPAPAARAGAERPLTAYTRYADAMRLCTAERLWALFDGDRAQLNIGHECLDRHPPRRIAVRIARAEGAYEAHTFGALSRASARFAHLLEARGIARGERVAIMLEPSLAFYACLFGAVKAGAVAVPLFTLFGPDGLRLRVADCTPRLLVVGPAHRELAEQLARELPGLEVLVADRAFERTLARHPARYTPRTAAGDMAIYQYTSGTTRELPEAVKHTHRAVVTVMIAALYGTGVRPGDRFCCPASPAWGQGLWHGTIAPLALGVTTGTWAGPFDAGRLADALHDWRVTNLAAAATHYRLLREAERAAGRHRESGPSEKRLGGKRPADGRYRHLRKLSYTGEPIDEVSLAWAEATFGATLCSMYGTTEVGVILANYPGAPDFTVKPGALGRPVPGAEVSVLDASGQPCPPGTVGEIKVRRRGEWFATKDRGHTDADGYFYHDGRADDVIISAGWTMSAVEIENVLLSHPAVVEAAVIAVPDATRGHVAKAYVVTRQQGDDALAAALQAHVRERLSRHAYPRQVAFAAALPKTPAGKVNRKALRDQEPRQPTGS